ncbi:MAG TPA: hypothetical protein VFK37_10450 [Bacillales bacterium]|nr:hypothetical protein [Bacillales bacterium]
MSKFLLKWTFLLLAGYFAYKNRSRLMHSLFGLQPLKTVADSKWTVKFMDRFMDKRASSNQV